MTVGSKVVCIDDKFPLEASKFYVALPKEGVVYVIRNMSIGVDWHGEPGEVVVHLVGLYNPKSNKSPFPERGFNAMRFRPLEETLERNKQNEPNELVNA